MTRDRYLERQVEKLTEENSELVARIVGLEARVETLKEARDGFRNGQIQMQHIIYSLRASIAEYAAERKASEIFQVNGKI